MTEKAGLRGPSDPSDPVLLRIPARVLLLPPSRPPVHEGTPSSTGVLYASQQHLSWNLRG